LLERSEKMDTKIKNLEIENQRLKTLVNELTFLNDLSRTMSSTLSVQEIMAQIINKSIQVTGVEQGTIMLLDESSKTSLKTMIRGVNEEHLGSYFTLGDHIMGWMLKNEQPLLSNDLSNDQRLSGVEIKKGIRSLLSMPMIFRGTLIGVINLFNKSTGPFSQDDQKVMSILATQVASFLANALTFSRVEDSNEKLQKRTVQLQKEVGSRYSLDGIIGASQKILNLKEEIKTLAQTPANVLIIGETGTGKELVAKTIHYNSDRKDKSFIDINAAAIPDNLIESEFFGVEVGAATGVNKRIGLFEVADGGTLFIDEIGDMSPASQAKILRVLQERQIRRVGGNSNINVDIRLIAATNKDLQKEMKKGSFREDLFYRLSVFQLKLPPLRERKEDILLLMDFFLKEFARRMGKMVLGFSPDVLTLFQNSDWPGNIRELANVIERAVIVTKDPVIDVPCLPIEFRGESTLAHKADGSFENALNNCKKVIIANALQASSNNKSEAARQLGISRTYLFRLLKQFGLGET
jgi:Nif-specific regulatory protein